MSNHQACTHVSLTSLYLTICWCRFCQGWSVDWSASGRVDQKGNVVLWEHLTDEHLAAEGSPEEALAWSQKILLGAQELEEDRVDADMLRWVKRKSHDS